MSMSCNGFLNSSSVIANLKAKTNRNNATTTAPRTTVKPKFPNIGQLLSGNKNRKMTRDPKAQAAHDQYIKNRDTLRRIPLH
jgi:transglutaminase/protease-like cytokinesis protein 3